MPELDLYTPVEAVPVIAGDQIEGMTQSVVQAIFPTHIFQSDYIFFLSDRT